MRESPPAPHLQLNPPCPTGLVAFRIWWLNRSIMAFLNHSYYPIMFLVLESGAVYSATLTALLILYKTGSWFQYVLLDAVRPRPRSVGFDTQPTLSRYRRSSVSSSP